MWVQCFYVTVKYDIILDSNLISFLLIIFEIQE